VESVRQPKKGIRVQGYKAIEVKKIFEEMN
jgi:hypothetical protein